VDAHGSFFREIYEGEFASQTKSKPLGESGKLHFGLKMRSILDRLECGLWTLVGWLMDAEKFAERCITGVMVSEQRNGVRRWPILEFPLEFKSNVGVCSLNFIKC
jgi:hypothetical protein